MIFKLTEDYQLQVGNYEHSRYHSWIPEFEIIKATKKAVRIAIPNEIFEKYGLEGRTSFDTVDIWIPKKCIILNFYDIETKKGRGWAWTKIYKENALKCIEQIKDRKNKFKPLKTVTLSRITDSAKGENE